MSRTATIQWGAFSGKHKAYIKAALHNRMCVAEGAIRSGKTIDHCIIAAAYLETTPDKYHLASGSTIANAKLNIGVCNGFGLENLFRGRCRWGKYKDNEALFISTQTGEKVVIFAGGAKSDSYKRILGNSYGMWIATEINEHYDSADSRTSFIKVANGRQLAAKRPFTLWDMNPCNPGHSIYENYIDRYRDNGLPGGYLYEHFTIADNATISPERLEEIKGQYVPGTVWYRRDIEGERTLAEGLIYPMYREAIGEPPKGNAAQYCVSLDYGTRNAFAALLWEQHAGVWYATREYYYSGRNEGRSKTDSEYGADLDRWLADIPGRLTVIIDPSAASFIALLRRKSGRYRVRPADNAVDDGIRETATALQTGRIKISEALDNWQDEASGYVWDESAGEDRPVKVDDHLMDATRYFVKTMRIATPKGVYVSPFAV